MFGVAAVVVDLAADKLMRAGDVTEGETKSLWFAGRLARDSRRVDVPVTLRSK